MSEDVSAGAEVYTLLLRLADFILANLEPILAEWEVFAQSIWPGAAVIEPGVLRDDAEKVLVAAAVDMKSPQTSIQQADKSKGKLRDGLGRVQSSRMDRASMAHGRDRHSWGYNLPAVISEYRALRASVVRLWRESVPAANDEDLEDLTRFHESMDQSLAEAVIEFTAMVEHARRAAMTEQTRMGEELLATNEALLVAGVRQMELAADAQQAMEKMAGSEREMTDFFETASIGLHWVGPDGTILRVNQSELDMLGYGEPGEREQYVGHHIAEFHVDQPVIEDILTRLRRGEMLYEYPARMCCKDGSIRDVLINSSAYFENGEFVHTRCFTQDVTEHKRAEEAQARLAAIVESSEDAIISKDLNGIITSWNRGAQHLFGYTAAEAVGKPVTMLIPEDHIDEEPKILARVKRGEVLEHYETVRRRKDGTLVDISLTVSPLRNAAGTIVGASKIARDITETVAMNKKLAEQTEHLAGESRRKDEFLAMLSHELRNPLAPIRTAVHLLRMQERGSENPVQKQAHEIIERQVANLTKLVSDLLEVSRVVTGRIHLHQQTVDLNQVILHAIETVMPLIEQRKHTLTRHLCTDPVWCDADATRIEEVFVNLLNNAAKYTPDGGKVEIWCEHPHGTNCAQVRIRDNGTGIDKELLPRIFDLFTQADRSLARSAGGLGIGLSLAHRIVELHSGSIEAHSEGPGHGAEFIVKLALSVNPPQATRERGELPAHAPQPAGIRVLVVDDNMDLVLMLATALRQKGYSVQSAYNGPDGLKIAQQWRPDVILLDIGLPGLDGYEVSRRLRSDPTLALGGNEGKHMRIIALTGYGRDVDVARAEEAGFDAHMVKPYELAALEKLMAVES